MQAARNEAALAARGAGVAHYADPASRASAERDFGGIAQGNCLLVAEPSGPEACQRLIGELAKRGLGCTVRGAGYGQSGQSIAQETVSLATRRLDWIGEFDPQSCTVNVGAGATLRRLLPALRESGYLPPVLPLNLDMSIGGLLSAGGIGPTSHRYGLVASNVQEIEIVTGNAEIVACTRQQNADLFHAVLGGVGQSGLISRITLQLRPAPRRVRVLSLLYNDIRRWLDDQLTVSSARSEFHIEGFCWASAKGLRCTTTGPLPYTHWMYGLQLAADADATDAQTIANLLTSLRPTSKVDEYETDVSAFLHRYEPRFAGMVQSGGWTEAHPWFEGMIPFETAADVIPRALSLLPAELGDGHRLTMVDTERLPAYFMGSSKRPAALFGVLPVAVPRNSLPKILDCVDRLTTLVIDAGGRRYLSGWLGNDAPEYFRAHFGNQFKQWVETRKKHDTAGVFRSHLFPRGHRG